MEFSFPFMTYDLFSYGSSQSGKLLGFIGLCATVLEGGVTRRMPALRMVQTGVLSCAASFFLLGRVQTEGMLYAAAALLAVTNATVVTGLKSLSSLEAGPAETGQKLGVHRSWGESSDHAELFLVDQMNQARLAGRSAHSSFARSTGGSGETSPTRLAASAC